MTYFVRIARKARTCRVCADPIEVGSHYVRWSTWDDGPRESVECVDCAVDHRLPELVAGMRP